MPLSPKKGSEASPGRKRWRAGNTGRGSGGTVCIMEIEDLSVHSCQG